MIKTLIHQKRMSLSSSNIWSIKSFKSSSMSRSRRGDASLQQHGHSGWHASKVPLVNCSRPVESGLSIKRGVYQGIVSSWDQKDDRPTNRCACGAPCAHEHHSQQAGQCVQKPRCDGQSGFRPMPWDLLRACTSTLLTKSNQRIPSIWCWHFHVDGF